MTGVKPEEAVPVEKNVDEEEYGAAVFKGGIPSNLFRGTAEGGRISMLCRTLAQYWTERSSISGKERAQCDALPGLAVLSCWRAS